MTLLELIEKLPTGLQLWRVHDRLAVDAPADTLTPELRAALIQHKPAILVAMILAEEFQQPRPRLRAVVLRTAERLGFPRIDLASKPDKCVAAGAAAWVTFIIRGRLASVIEAGLCLDDEIEHEAEFGAPARAEI